jgi:hypothetical protein
MTTKPRLDDKLSTVSDKLSTVSDKLSKKEK